MIPHGSGGSVGRRKRQASKDSSTLWKNCRQFLWRNNFKLGVGTIAGLFVRSPSAELRRMPKAISLHVVISNFYNQFRPHWFPRQIFALAPATLSAGHSLNAFIIFGRVLSPCLPRMVHQCIFSIRLEKLHQLFSFRRAETRTDPNVLQSAGIVEQTEQQRAYHRLLAFFMPAESSHHAIAVAFVFHFKHHSLVRLVSSCEDPWPSHHPSLRLQNGETNRRQYSDRWLQV